MLANLVAPLLLLAHQPGKESEFPQGTVPVKIGANLEGIADWSYSNAFADLMKQSRTFGTPSTPWAGKVQVDAEGWPKEDFGVVLATWPGVKNVGGTYKIQFQCKSLPAIRLVSSPGTIEESM